MKLIRVLLALALTVTLCGVAYVAQLAEPSGSKMTTAAAKLLDSLTPDQKAKAVLDFDDKERLNWRFTPRQDQARKPTRKGLPLEEMNAEQKQAALGLLRAGTSPDGAKKAETIMSLESILHDLEKGGAMVRNPQWYFFAVFGKPTQTGKWGWRVEGHHLALNFVIDAGKLSAATPNFFGANPATVMAGPRKGLRTLPQADDLAMQLFKELDEGQKKVAYQEKNFSEIKEGRPEAGVGEPKGLAAAKMSPKQRDLLMRLLQAYADRMPEDVAQSEMAQVKEAGLDKVYFAYAGGAEPGKPHTYRIQGPTFVVEFLNVQADSAKNPANHIHSAWRHLPIDFGLSARRP
jgi:hypothetical protein